MCCTLLFPGDNLLSACLYQEKFFPPVKWELQGAPQLLGSGRRRRWPEGQEQSEVRCCWSTGQEANEIDPAGYTTTQSHVSYGLCTEVRTAGVEQIWWQEQNFLLPRVDVGRTDSCMNLDTHFLHSQNMLKLTAPFPGTGSGSRRRLQMLSRSVLPDGKLALTTSSYRSWINPPLPSCDHKSGANCFTK